MGGAMYGTHNPDDHEAVRRQNTLDAAEGFGPVATRASSPGTRESTLEGPISSPPGKRVVARFVNDDGSGASECLVTLKPAAQRLSPTQILETLGAELSKFARTVLGVEDEGPIGRALELTSGKPAVLRIDGSRREGWLLQTRLPPRRSNRDVAGRSEHRAFNDFHRGLDQGSRQNVAFENGHLGAGIRSPRYVLSCSVVLRVAATRLWDWFIAPGHP